MACTLLIVTWVQSAQACVDSGVNAYFAKTNASEDDFQNFVEFIKVNYSVTVVRPDEDHRHFVHAKPDLDRSEAVCFSETWLLLNDKKSIGIVWKHKNEVSNEAISDCDKFFDKLVTKFQKQNNIPVDTEFYKGC